MSGITIFLAVFSVLGGGGGVDEDMTHLCPSHPYWTICPPIFTILVIRSTAMASSHVDTSDWCYPKDRRLQGRAAWAISIGLRV